MVIRDKIESGRIVYDEDGHPRWEWRTASGIVCHETDPARISELLKSMADDITLTSTDADRSHRTLDDMRRLSEEIKRLRTEALEKTQPLRTLK